MVDQSKFSNILSLMDKIEKELYLSFYHMEAEQVKLQDTRKIFKTRKPDNYAAIKTFAGKL